MKIYVLMKRTFDTEEKIVIQNNEIIDESAQFIINPYDEYAIEEAIHRIEHSTYGICMECENEIAPARLEAVPWTRVCIECKAKQQQS